MAYLTLLALLIFSASAFTFLFGRTLKKDISVISALQNIDRFADLCRKNLLAIREHFPDSTVDSKENALIITSESGEKFTLSYSLKRLTIISSVPHSIPSRSFPCEGKMIRFEIIGKKDKRPLKIQETENILVIFEKEDGGLVEFVLCLI